MIDLQLRVQLSLTVVDDSAPDLPCCCDKTCTLFPPWEEYCEERILALLDLAQDSGTHAVQLRACHWESADIDAELCPVVLLKRLKRRVGASALLCWCGTVASLRSSHTSHITYVCYADPLHPSAGTSAWSFLKCALLFMQRCRPKLQKACPVQSVEDHDMPS